MAKYVIKFMPEYMATSLWSVSDNADDRFGSPIQYDNIDLSSELANELLLFDDKVMGIVDWAEPNGPSPMSQEEHDNLYKQGQMLLKRIRIELGDDFEVIDASDWIR